MFEVEAEGVEQLLKKFETFDRQLTELHKQMPDELVDWQRDDMHRKFPNITVLESEATTTAETDIWPRSRLEQPGQRRAKRPTLAMPKQYRVKGTGRRPPSTRPVLRTELFTKLVDRMTNLLGKATKWP